MAPTARLHGPFCGLPCADMTITLFRGKAPRVEGGCPVCRSGITRDDLDEDAAPRVAGRRVSLEEAIGAAAKALVEARSPFLYGLSRSGNATARAAVAVAAAVGGALDIEGGDRNLPDLTALQSYGLPSATFGEIHNRADLLLLWRADPRADHPRAFGEPAGTPLEGPGARAVILVPPAAQRTIPPADLVLPVVDGGDLETLLGLRALVRGRTPAGERLGGVPIADVRAAAERLSRARYSAIVWDGEATAPPGGAAIACALALLARDLNAAGRCAARPLGSGNIAGAMATLLGLTGAPRAIGFASGRPRYAPGEYDATRMIGSAAADLILLVGARAVPPTGVRRAAGGLGGAGGRGILIVVGPRRPDGVADPDIMIPTALPGIAAGGSVRRVDGLPLILRAVLPSSRPREEDVLQEVLSLVLEKRRAAG